MRKTMGKEGDGFFQPESAQELEEH